MEGPFDAIFGETPGHRHKPTIRKPGRCVCGVYLSRYRRKGEKKCCACRANPKRYAAAKAADLLERTAA